MERAEISSLEKEPPHGKEHLWTAGETAGLQREPKNVNMHVNMNDEGRREYNVFNMGGERGLFV